MLLGIEFSPIKVADDLIVDGHHHYVASLLAKTNIDIIPSLKTAATQKQFGHLFNWIYKTGTQRQRFSSSMKKMHALMASISNES